MSQIYSSGGYLFTFDDDGVNAHTLDGVLVSGITTGFTPWLVEDTVGAPTAVVVIVPPTNIVYPSVPVVEPPHVIVPEPHLGLAVLIILVVFVIFMIKETKDDGE